MQSMDPRQAVDALHAGATAQIMQLMTGLFGNIEDSLFEIAFGLHGQENLARKRQLGELMRDLRLRKTPFLKQFNRQLVDSKPLWFSGTPMATDVVEERAQAQALAAKCNAHFGHLLKNIADRTANATGHEVEIRSLPLGPEQLSYLFLHSFGHITVDEYSQRVVQGLFARFVLDRLGSVYAGINAVLEEAGFSTTPLESSVSRSA